MAYREGDRCQMTLLPPVIEEYVAQDDPVRAYDAIIEAMDTDKLGLVIERNQVGNPAYDPKTMLKLLVYGYSYGWHSSRKLERACHHNLSFIWLMGGLKPDHKTIANFRKDNKGVIREVLKQTARICLRIDLIEGNCLFSDSTKVRGAASISETRTLKGWEQKLEARYASEEGQAICRKRKAKVELPFGHIKRNLNGGAFLVRGLAGVRAEWAILPVASTLPG
jgi:transposase